MLYSPENSDGSFQSHSPDDDGQYDFFETLESNEDPIKKFPLDFGEEALFDAREPNLLQIYGNAGGTSAIIHFDKDVKILDVTVRGDFENEAQAREVFTSKATYIFKKHGADMGL